MVPDQLLRSIIRRLNVDVHVPATRRPKEIAALVRAIEGLPKSDYDRVEAALRPIHALGERDGPALLVAVDREAGAGDIDRHLPAAADAYHWAAWAWINRPAVFKMATNLLLVDELSGWRRRDDLPSRPADLSRGAINGLEAELAATLVAAQCRGRRCTVEAQARGDTTYVFAYADDFVRTVQTHDRRGRLRRRAHRPTFEVVFAFDQAKGVLQTAANVPPKVKDKLDQAFARHCLDHPLGPFLPGPAYHLDLVLEADFAFITEAADGVHLRLRKACLEFPDSDRGIDLTNDPDRDSDLWPLLGCLDPRRVTLEAMRVKSIRVEAVFDATDEEPAGSVTFHVSRRTCNLRDQPERRVRLIEKCFRASGLLVQGKG
jgi:hypothetical protein